MIWREQDPAGYVTRLGDVQIELQNVWFRSGSLLSLRFCCADDEFDIREPLAQGWFGRKYSTEDQRNLALLMRGLARAAARQCSHRRMRALEHPEQVRERVYRQLLFEQPGYEAGGSLAPLATAWEAEGPAR